MIKKRLYFLILIIICITLAVCFSACDDKQEETPTEEAVIIKLFACDVSGKNPVQHDVEKGKENEIIFNNNSYIFYGYYTQQNGQGIRVTDNKGKVLSSFFDEATQTSYNIYPKVEAKTFNITLVSSTGEQFEMYTLTTEDDQTLPTATKKGYYFVGWGEGENELYEFGQTTYTTIWKGTVTTDAILYPKFRPKTITVIGNNGNVSVEYGTAFHLNYDTSVAGKTFMGYYTLADGNGRQITDPIGNSLTEFYFAEDEEESNSITYVAYYIDGEMYQVTIPNQGMVNGIFVTYKNFYSEGSPDRVEYYVKNQTIKNLKPTRDGYFFDGWYTESGLFHKYDFDVAHSEQENFVLYPKWIALPTNKGIIKDVLSNATQGTVVLTNSSNATTYHAYYSDFNGTITVSCRVFTTAGNSSGAQVYAGGIDLGEMAEGASKSVSIDVKKGEIVYFTGSPVKYSENINLVYTITAGIPTLSSNVKADVPVVFNVIVTKGNPFKLPVYQKSGYIFHGYTTTENDPSTIITNDEGESFNEWYYDENMTVYAYYTQNP